MADMVEAGVDVRRWELALERVWIAEEGSNGRGPSGDGVRRFSEGGVSLGLATATDFSR